MTPASSTTWGTGMSTICSAVRRWILFEALFVAPSLAFPPTAPSSAAREHREFSMFCSSKHCRTVSWEKTLKSAFSSQHLRHRRFETRHRNVRKRRSKAREFLRRIQQGRPQISTSKSVQDLWNQQMCLQTRRHERRVRTVAE